MIEIRKKKTVTIESKEVVSGINRSTQTCMGKDIMHYKMSKNEKKHQSNIDDER